MRIGIHQPNFFPWMGYFFKIAQCDLFVFLDHVEFTKKSFTKRVKIHKPNNLLEEQYMLLPLQKHSDHASIDSLQLVASDTWQKKIITQIYQSYHKAPYYYQIEPLIESYFTSPRINNSFSEFTIEIIQYISELLELNVQWITSSAIDIPYAGFDINLEIVSFLEGQTYISGLGAKKYQNENLFITKNIDLIYSDFPSFFKNLNVPVHFLNKSILSYLVHYKVDEVQKMLNVK